MSPSWHIRPDGTIEDGGKALYLYYKIDYEYPWNSLFSLMWSDISCSLEVRLRICAGDMSSRANVYFRSISHTIHSDTRDVMISFLSTLPAHI